MFTIFGEVGLSNVQFVQTFDSDHKVTVAIVGAGAAGLIAALAAKDTGANVMVFECDSWPSGSTALSSGFIPACNTRWQSAIGSNDTIDLFAGDIQRKNKNQSDYEFVRNICSISAGVLHWLADQHQQEFILIDQFLYPGHTTHRMHAHPKRTGLALIDSLLKAAEKAGIDIVCSAQVEDLFAETNGLIRGLAIKRPNGVQELVGCDSLILACNGFGGNRVMVEEFIPEMSDALYFGHSGNKGEAVLWGKQLGVGVSQMGSYQGHGSVATPHGILITWAIIMEGGIQLNCMGERFSNETEGYSEQALNVLRQPRGIAWNVFDERLHKLGLEFEDYRQAQENGAVQVANSFEDLANIIGAPVNAVNNSLELINKYSKTNLSCPFGRIFNNKKGLQGPPFYLVKVTGALFHTQGGLMVDNQARVLKPDGSKLPNLFASGGAAVGVSGKGVDGYLSGNGLLTAMTLGYLAGRSAGEQTRIV